MVCLFVAAAGIFAFKQQMTFEQLEQMAEVRAFGK